MTNIIDLFADVTPEKAALILSWSGTRRSFRDWSRIFGVAVETITKSVAAYTASNEWNTRSWRKSDHEQIPSLSPKQMQTLVSWYRKRKTRRQLAKELELTEWQVQAVIRYAQVRNPNGIEDALASLAAARATGSR